MMKRTKFATKVKKDSQRWNPPKPKRSKPKKGYRILIAENLKPMMKALANNPPPIPGFSISRMEYLIHLIISRKQEKHKGSYSILNMEYLRKVVPQAGRYIQFLKKQGVIEWVNYSAGRNSRLYRLAEESRVEFRTITDQNLIRRIEEARKQIRRRNSKKYPHLNKFIHQVHIDYDGALEAIEKDYEASPDKESAELRRTYSLAAIERIRSGELFIKVNKTNYRLDSNFTNLPSMLLAYLQIDGQRLYEIDITNSQPFFVLSLFNPTPEIEQLITDYLGEDLTMYIKTLKAIEREDVKRYVTLVTSGRFYDYMGTVFKERDRKAVKERLFMVFFGSKHAYHYSEEVEAFREAFPTVFSLFYRIKGKGKKKNRLAILLQRIEAYTMLDRVAMRIAQELPELPILTRHDSILPFKQRLMIPGYENALHSTVEIMVDTIEEVVGVRPQGRLRKYTRKQR